MKLKLLGKKSVSHVALRFFEVLILSLVFSPLINLIPGENTIELGNISFEICGKDTFLAVYFAKLSNWANITVILLCVRKMLKNLYQIENIKELSGKKNYRYLFTIGISVSVYSFVKPVFDYLSSEEVYGRLLASGISTSLNYTVDYEFLFMGFVVLSIGFIQRMVEKELIGYDG